MSSLTRNKIRVPAKIRALDLAILRNNIGY